MSKVELDTCETEEAEVPRHVQLRKRPWQYLGYPALCDWSASDNDLFVLRRFKALNTRVLLRMQDSISQLEEELIEIDAENSQMGSSPVNNGSFRNEMVERREEILTEAGSKLKEYNEYLINYSNIRSRPQADEHAISNVNNWLLDCCRDAIFPEESKYITKEDDLIRVVHEKRTPLRKIVGKYSSITQNMFMKKIDTDDIKGYDPEATAYWDDKKVESCARSVIITTGLVMLIAPQWWLLFVQDRRIQLGIITGFIIIFLVLVATVTGARPFESLAATAAYAAVLTVFMQVGSYTGD